MKYLILLVCVFTGINAFSQTVPGIGHKPDSTADERAYVVVEQMPEHPGGVIKLNEFINKNLNYPKRSKRNGVEGTVFISFIVERDGTMSDAKIVKGVNEEMDNEAMRVVMILPKWIPGRQNGKVVRARYVLPVKFKKR